MKKAMLALFFCMLLAVTSVFATSVDDAAANLAADLQKQYSQKTVLKIAIADLVTPGNSKSTFGDYLTESFGDAFKTSGSKFQVLDQQLVSAVFFKKKIQLNRAYDNTVLNMVTKGIYDVTQEAAAAYLYGQIKDMGDEIKITVKLVDAISGSSIALSSVKFPSDETTDKLLGKPVREHKSARIDTVVVVKEKIVETPVPVPTQEDSKTIISINAFKIGSFSVNLKQCSYAGNSLVLTFVVTNADESTRELELKAVRMVDPDGSVYTCRNIVIGNDNGGAYISSKVIGNAPVKATMTFDDVTHGLKMIKAVQITAQGEEFVLRDLLVN